MLSFVSPGGGVMSPANYCVFFKAFLGKFPSPLASVPQNDALRD